MATWTQVMMMLCSGKVVVENDVNLENNTIHLRWHGPCDKAATRVWIVVLEAHESVRVRLMDKRCVFTWHRPAVQVSDIESEGGRHKNNKTTRWSQIHPQPDALTNWTQVNAQPDTVWRDTVWREEEEWLRNVVKKCRELKVSDDCLLQSVCGSNNNAADPISRECFLVPFTFPLCIVQTTSVCCCSLVYYRRQTGEGILRLGTITSRREECE